MNVTSKAKYNPWFSRAVVHFKHLGFS